jgi:hypothetical protein
MKYTEPRTRPETFPDPNEGQNVMPKRPVTDDEIIENDAGTQVDMDKEKLKYYPKSIPPEEY